MKGQGVETWGQCTMFRRVFMTHKSGYPLDPDYPLGTFTLVQSISIYRIPNLCPSVYKTLGSLLARVKCKGQVTKE